MIEQTFKEKVPDVIEILSQAAKYAGDQSINNMVVRLEVRYLGLEIRISRAIYVPGNLKINTIIGWTELAQARDGLELIKYRIDEKISQLNNAIREYRG